MANIDVKIELVYLLTCEQLHVLMYMKALKKLRRENYDVSLSIPSAREYLRMGSDKIRHCLRVLTKLNIIEKRFEAITKARMPAVYHLNDYAAANQIGSWAESNRLPGESTFTAIKRYAKQHNYRRTPI